MFANIEWQFPAPRPVVPFDTWLEELRTGEQLVDWHLETDPSHFEVRNTYAEYNVVLWERYKELLVNHVDKARLAEVIPTGRSMVVNDRLPRDLRNRAWRALPNVFLQGFEPFAKYQEDDEIAPFGGLEYECFMWWDVCSYYPGCPSNTWEDDAYFLATCKVCLDSPNFALHESALHGLGHSIGMSNGLKESVKVIDDYLRAHPDLPPKLQSYARQARNGRVQ